MNPKWAIINALLGVVFRKDLIRPGENHLMATIAAPDFTYAILEDMSGTMPNTIKLQMRASALPHDAVRIALAISTVFKVVMGPHFESNDKGDILFGNKALKHLWGYIPNGVDDHFFDEELLEKQYDSPN